jgi:diguanylate cyclase (GGDEF)-like protein/PAS domain S-box-containing protein
METILVVDDNRQISSFLVGSVLPSLGYQTLVAYDGKSALEIVRKHHRYIDLMLLDLQLPDYSGLDILRKLAKENLTVPAILFTAHGSEQVAVEAFRLGAQDYLNKPVDVDILSVTIARSLSNTRLRKEKDRLNVQLKEQVNWLTVLSRVSKSITSTLNIDDVLKRIVEAGVLLTRADEGFLALLDQPSGQLYLRAVKNIDENKINTMRLPVTDSLSGKVIRDAKPIRSTQGEDNPLKVSTGFLVYSLVHVPLISKGVPLGVLAVDNRTTRRGFTATDEAMLISLADYAAVALENAKLYEQVTLELQERERAEEALRESQERYELSVRGAKDGIWDWNLRTQEMYFSPRWKEMLGYEEQEIQNKPEDWFNRIHPDDRDAVRENIAAHLRGGSPNFENEYRMLHKDGSYRWMLSRGLAVRDEAGVAHRIAGSQTDISDRKIAEQKLIYDALHDTVTGLFNRSALIERLWLAINRGKRRAGYLFALLYMDLDRFKDVNDSLGHMLGDELLIAIAKMLQGVLRPTDTVARLGGDEFVVLLDDIGDIRDATLVADRIQQELTTAPLLHDHEVFVSASIGIVLSSSGYNDPVDVLRDADIAMYRAKAHGRSRYEIFDPLMRERIMERLALENELRQAIDRQEFLVYYQPILSIADHHLLGFEALLRWQSPTRGLLTPIHFLEVAENTGLISTIDRWVLKESLLQLRYWDSIFPNIIPLTMSVNVSGKHVAQMGLADEVALILEETGMDASRLNLEITEDTVMENVTRTNEVLAKIQALGVQLQVDDFGIGYSSLGYLSSFSLNALKIDRSFVNSLDNDGTNLKIIQAILMMSRGLGMKVIAEGVETQNQFAQLRELGCEFAQGYLIAMPLPKLDATQLLEKVFGPNNGKTDPWNFLG